MSTLVDIFVVIFYAATFISALIVIGLFAVLSYAEIKGYIEEIKQNRKDAETLRRAEEYRDDFN